MNEPKTLQRLLGAHMSIAGGVVKSIERGLSVGCTAIQIFTGYNNRWISKDISPDDLAEFHQKKSRVGIIFAHNNYLWSIIHSPSSYPNKGIVNPRGQVTFGAKPDI